MTFGARLRKIGKSVIPRLRRSKFNATDATQSLDFLNHRPMPPNAFTILFIGNSVMMHGKSKGLWDLCCGIAASSPENDYVHQVVRSVQSRMERPVEALYNNGGDGTIVHMLAYAEHTALKPELVILQGGENDEFKEGFRYTYRSLLDFYPVPYVVIGDFFLKEKSDFSRQECESRGYPFVNLFAIHQDPINSGDGGPYADPAVATHPNDRGMTAIASEVIARLPHLSHISRIVH